MPQKKHFEGGIGNFYLGQPMPVNIGNAPKIPKTGWHLTPAITSELAVVAVGTDLVLTWVGCSTSPAINPRDTRTQPKATPVSSSVPTGLGVGCYTRVTRVGIASPGTPEEGTRSFPSPVAPSSLSPLDMQTTPKPGWRR